MAVKHDIEVQLHYTALSFPCLPVKRFSSHSLFLNIGFYQVLQFGGYRLISRLREKGIDDKGRVADLLFAPHRRGIFIFRLNFLHNKAPFMPFH